MYPVAVLFLLSCFIGLYLNLCVIPPKTDTLTALVINGVVGILVGLFVLIVMPF